MYVKVKFADARGDGDGGEGRRRGDGDGGAVIARFSRRGLEAWEDARWKEPREARRRFASTVRRWRVERRRLRFDANAKGRG